jgi:hypothetical protein
VYAKLWRRSALDTDLGFYEIRYSGRPGRVRGFGAILGVFFTYDHGVRGRWAAIKMAGDVRAVTVMTLLCASAGVAV